MHRSTSLDTMTQAQKVYQLKGKPDGNDSLSKMILTFFIALKMHVWYNVPIGLGSLQSNIGQIF